MTNYQPTWDFDVYDLAFARHAPDTSTAVRRAAVTFEDSVRNDVVENGAFIKANGTLLLQRVGLANRISFSPSELTSAMNCLFTHNHPNGHSFSYSDVQIAVSYRFIEIRAVSAHWRHIMAPVTSWPSVPALVAAIRAETQRANANIHKMLNSGQLSKRFVGLELQHQLWMLVSRRLNLEYRREAS
jgi:hypothetical protein